MHHKIVPKYGEVVVDEYDGVGQADLLIVLVDPLLVLRPARNEIQREFKRQRGATLYSLSNHLVDTLALYIHI